MKNIDVRQYALAKDIKLWQIADKMHICDSSLSRIFRRELSEEKKAEIRAIIDELATGR